MFHKVGMILCCETLTGERSTGFYLLILVYIDGIIICQIAALVVVLDLRH